MPNFEGPLWSSNILQYWMTKIIIKILTYSANGDRVASLVASCFALVKLVTLEIAFRTQPPV